MPAIERRQFILKREEDGRYERCSSHFFTAKVKKILATTHATANTQTTHPHGLPFTPTVHDILFVTTGDKAGNAYLSAAPDAEKVYLKATVGGLTTTIWIFYRD